MPLPFLQPKPAPPLRPQSPRSVGLCQFEPLLRALIEGEAGILSLSIERPGLHDAFVAIAGEAAAQALVEEKEAGR